MWQMSWMHQMSTCSWPIKSNSNIKDANWHLFGCVSKPIEGIAQQVESFSIFVKFETSSSANDLHLKCWHLAVAS